ncbi:hypothetical protein HID58_044777 [Brassica napus]|uniref:Uncharacterized protein n=2 Tax=Brassica napus TaxID=3708 RepID=A0ABQ8BKE4_BRANA|nr:hypothetical protein HID58_044777 [Brassica napus]CAF2374200.1 unnamed protein product [Brassica napus]CAF2375224.1 unnamed protein product [Brassica napus]CDY28687.1 BnaCnng05730D [Brassica napus]
MLTYNGERFWKPICGKPVNGGGMKGLFGKVSLCRISWLVYTVLCQGFKIGNRSSEFHPEVRRVRRECSFIYEELMPTVGTDVKVCVIVCHMHACFLISSFPSFGPLN